MEYNFESVNKIFEASIKANWNNPAISNFKGDGYTYGELAANIEKLHILFEESGLKQGDRVSLCSRNQANWVVAFLATMTYGAVPVPILHDFKAASVHNLVNHSESRILFADGPVWANLDPAQMPDLDMIFDMDKLTLRSAGKAKLLQTEKDIRKIFNKKFPQFGPQDLNFYEDSPEELAVINYTSGTSGFSKGVMIPYRAIWSNIDFGRHVMDWLGPQHNMISMLPCAHMYGLMFEVLFEMTKGVHIHFLTRVPSPKIILDAMAEIRPDLIIAVPLIIEKVYKSKVQPILGKPAVNFAVKYIPFFKGLLYGKIRKALTEAFGGRFYEVIMGGAAFNKEIEHVFHDMKFRFTVGYGMTECAPIITYADWKVARVGSSGVAAPNMEIRIESRDPRNVPGEIQVRGANVFQGYYKAPEETAECFTEDGWFRTGDMGVIDEDGFLYIKGRNKCMILGPSGQNIYPEEIETVLNNIPNVIDTLVVEENNSLTALVYPDYAALKKLGIKSQDTQKHIEDQVRLANRDLPNYAQIKKVELMEDDFERTPKKSIKRYLYKKQ